MTLWYYEIANFAGRPCSRTVPTQPRIAIRGGVRRIQTTDGVGGRLVRDPVLIKPEHEKYDLEILKLLYTEPLK